MLNSGRGNAQGGGSGSHATEPFDHVGYRSHVQDMYDYRSERQAALFDDRTVHVCTDFVQERMDDRIRIRDAMESGSISREALAEVLGVSVPSIGRLLRCDRELKARERDKAFQFLGLSGRAAEPLAPDARQVPIIGLIAAGNWSDAISQPLGFTWTDRGGKSSFALQVDGDSMDQIAPPGALIIIDPDDRDLLDGKAYAVMNDMGETTFKTFRVDPARLEPASSNKTHCTIVLGRDGFRIIGRAVKIVADL